MGFVEGGKPEKKPQSKAKTNNKLNPRMAQGRNRIRATLVGGEHSHHCATDCSLVSHLCLLGSTTVLYFKKKESVRSSTTYVCACTRVNVGSETRHLSIKENVLS